MKDRPTKPWSPPWADPPAAELVDDELESDSIPAGGAAHPPAAGLGKTPSAKPLFWSQVRRWSVGALGGAFPIVLAAIWSLVALLAKPSFPIPHFAGIFVLCATAVGLHLRARTARRAGLDTVRDRIGDPLQSAGSAPMDGSLDGELHPIWQAVERHADNIQQRLSDVLKEHSRLGLELTLSTTQKRVVAAIIDSITDPVLVTDAFDQLVLANPAAAELLGFERGPALRRPIEEIIRDARLVAILRQAREADSRAARRRIDFDLCSRAFSVTLSPVRLSAHDGAIATEPFGGLTTASPAGTGFVVSAQPNGEGVPRSAEALRGGERHGVVALLRDVTKDREAARLKSEFVAQAAHELRTPLSAIRAYVEMLVDGEAADEKTRAEYYDIIETSANRLGRMIDNILNISRIEAGTVRVNKEPVAISMIVKEAADTMRPQAEQKRIDLTEEPAPVVDRILADRDLMQQALLNLISNAIKYTPEGGQVCTRMLTRHDHGTIRIEVSDTGAGIPAEDLPRMFERFFRVEANKQLAAGTGLGLSLVKQIVETVHGGEMSITSEVGKGSTFAMTLPLYVA